MDRARQATESLPQFQMRLAFLEARQSPQALTEGRGNGGMKPRYTSDVTLDVTSDNVAHPSANTCYRTRRLPGPLVVRFFVWLALSCVFPLSVTATWLSFEVEVLGRTISALPPGSAATLPQQVQGVLRHLEAAEQKEINPHFRADYRIAYLTVEWSSTGIPLWSYQRESPYAAATFAVLACSPEDVWPNVCAERRQKLGKFYSLIYDEAGNLKPDHALEEILRGSPKKPPGSVRRMSARRSV
jgi:hypothetical protein